MRASLLVSTSAFVAAVACARPPPPSTTPTPSASASASTTATSPSWCVDPDHCDDGLKHCLEVCYKRNHPNGPANGDCDDGCREAYCGRTLCALD